MLGHNHLPRGLQGRPRVGRRTFLSRQSASPAVAAGGRAPSGAEAAVPGQSRMSRFPLLRAVTGATLPLLLQSVVVITCLGWYHALAARISPLRGPAYANAAWVIGLERRLGILVEPRVQTVLGMLAAGHLRSATVWIYAHGYITCPLSALLWLFLFRPERFALIRDSVILSSAAALAIYALFPVAPPRFALAGAPWGIQDWVHGTSLTNHLTATATEYLGFNAYAAVPSVHVMWAMLTALAVAVGVRHWALRALAFLYPAAMIVTVVATGNHYFFDCVAAGGLVVLSMLVVLLVHRVLRHLYRAFLFSTPCPLAAAARRRRLPTMAGQFASVLVRLQGLQAPLLLCVAVTAPLVLVDRAALTVAVVCLFVLLVLAIVVVDLVVRRETDQRAHAHASLTDGLAGLLLVAGAAGMTDPPGHALFYISTALRMTAALLALGGRLGPWDLLAQAASRVRRTPQAHPIGLARQAVADR